MLEGIQVKPLKTIGDERGFFTELMRIDWKELLDGDSLKQANFSISYPGIVRAWHKHARGQVDYFVVLKGALKICVYDDASKELDEIVSSGNELKVVRVPGSYWHGFKVIGNEPAWLIYFVTKLYDYHNPDEERIPWNEPSVVPSLINGKSDDPRVGKPWDWFALSHS